MSPGQRLIGTLACLALTACGGGGGGDDGGGASNTSLSVAPGSVSFQSVEGDALPATVVVRATFVGDGVVVGFAPGVPQPAWLNVVQQATTASTVDVALTVTDGAVGTRSTSLRFATGRSDGSNVKTFDLPISFAVTASDLAIALDQNNFTFTALTQGALPTARSIVATFNGSQVQLVSQLPSWLTVTAPANLNASPATFGIAINDTNFTAGSVLVADLNFRTSRPGSTLQRTSTLHIEYQVNELFSVVPGAANLTFNAIRRSAQPPAPSAGYGLTIRGNRARWRVSGSQPWLRFNPANGTGQATVTVTADATGQALGTNNAQVTVTDDDSGQSVNLPASLILRAARLVVTPADARFELDTLTSASALSQNVTISDELGGTQASETVNWSVQSVSVPWLRLAPTSGTTAPAVLASLSLDADEVALLRPGDRSGSVTFTYQNADGANQTLVVPVDFDNRLAYVDFVSPYIGIANQAGTLYARGVNFGTAGSALTVDVGNTAIGPLVADSDTQIRVAYPARPPGRYTVSVRNLAGIVSPNAELLVIAPTVFPYQVINAPAPNERRKIAYDAERQTLYAVNRADQAIERYTYAGASFSAQTPLILPEVTDLTLAPNGRSLVVSTMDVINDIQLGSTPFVAVPRAFNPDPFCGRFFDTVTMSNSGAVLIVTNMTGCSGYTATHLYNMLDYSLTQNPFFLGFLYNGTADVSADGSRMVAGSNGLSPAPEVKRFDALTGAFTDTILRYNLSAVSVSGNASRVILENRDVYDSTMASPTGFLSAQFQDGIALVSRDSRRAFVYRDSNDQPRIDIYDLEGALLPGALYPLIDTVPLADSPSVNAGEYFFISMAATPDDSVVFISGNSRILVVPVN